MLEAIHQYFTQASREALAYSTAAEWILDNNYIIQQAIRHVKNGLPSDYYRQLPKLSGSGDYLGYPRVFALARQYTLQEHCYIDMDRVKRFLAAYQEIAPLTIGEVWVLPIMLRFCLLECLAQTADEVPQQLAAKSGIAPALIFAPDADSAHVVANCILSLRLLDSHNWETFFENVNLSEQILRQDPARIYGGMTFETRDNYRKVVEMLALATGRPEVEVAGAAVRLAESGGASAAKDGEWIGLRCPPDAHVGAYLIGPSRKELETAVGYRPNVVLRWFREHVLWLYLGSVTLLTLIFVALLASYALNASGAGPSDIWWQLLLVAGLGVMPASSAAHGLVNWIVTAVVKPARLPKLDFSEGIPGSCRTMVVIPALLSDKAEIQSLFKQLEQHYLRNPDPHFGFALLTDFADAPEATMPEDDRLIEQAEVELRALNQRYSGRPFHFLHRSRQHNLVEGVWMGWERKRGKLHEFNRLLRGAEDTTFVVQGGDQTVFSQVRYVITLDADTVLPVDAANRLVGAIAHPLNRAQFDRENGRVIAGYTVLQPRTEIIPSAAGQSLFTRVFAGDIGLDLYTLAVSDVYQDLFGEGIFVGKGIYDVDAFEQSLEGHIPENALLSHDLFEGVQGRAGLVTDIVLYEDFPTHYLAHVRRSHRWIRGDWQLLPWLWPTVPAAQGQRDNDLPPLARWKIADNLRRSLVAPFLFLFFMAGWLWLPGSPTVWTLAGLGLSGISIGTALLMAVSRGIGGATWRDVRRPVRDSAIRWLLQIAFLPYEALLHLDAIALTLWRLFVFRRHLLQWTTAAHTARLLGDEVSAEKTAGQMVRSMIVVLILFVLMVAWQPAALTPAVPLMILWVLSAEIAHRISQPAAPDSTPLSAAQARQLRSLARRTWLFFEEFVGPEDNWLPPDHFQESPKGTVAHRTSPTNVGLYLLSALAAYDLGYISLLDLSLRLTDTFDALDKLEQYRGHFLNWIDTRSLGTLTPHYVSTVDSGNLAGSLLTLKQGCLTMKEREVFPPQRWQGFLDTVSLLEEAAGAVSNSNVVGIEEQVGNIRELVGDARDEPALWAACLEQLIGTDLPELDQRLLAFFEAGTADVSPTMVRQWRLYTEHIWGNAHNMKRDLELLCPWMAALKETPSYFDSQVATAKVQTSWAALQEALPRMPRFNALQTVCRQAEAKLQALQDALPSPDTSPDIAEVAEAAEWCAELQKMMVNVRLSAEPLLTSYEILAQRAGQYVAEMDFTFLYDGRKHVFHIGYSLDSSRLDNNYYDLLASEARIGSLVAIAKREVPQKHWLHLARPLTRLHKGVSLLSWSGTMFEYLMPPLFMESYKGTLLAQSCQAVVDHQIAYGNSQDVPWGISESGFYTFDNAQNYQYRAFGVPGAGLKRGLSEELVISPYASLMALPIRPQAVMANLEKLSRYQMMGMYGLYEAIDFTPSRLQLGQKSAIVRSFMSHHQGMILLALANHLEDNVMVRRFHSEPTIQSVTLLLQEQVPGSAPLQQPHEEEDGDVRPAGTGINVDPWSVSVGAATPLVHYLSNGRFGTLISNAGGGYLRKEDVALTRWRPDTTCDDWGLWLYVQDMEDGALWSAGVQPIGRESPNQEVTFYPHMAEFRRHDRGITLQMTVIVAPEADVEIRLVNLTNDSDRSRQLRLCSYGEVVLTDYESDRRHPAFAKLFVESEYVPEQNALFFRRRPRSAKESPRFLGHMLVAAGDAPLTGAFESDRAEFLGRSRTAGNPAALERADEWLTGATGATLDPIMALGQKVTLKPHSGIELAWITFTADTRTGLLALAQEYQRWVTIRRAFTGARTQAEQELRRLNLPSPELAQMQRLLSLLLYPHSAMRADAATLAANSEGQPGLWSYDISGDYPILLLRLEEETNSELLSLLLRAHIYWRRRGLRVDLVILNEQETNYGQPVQNHIFRAIQQMESEHRLNKRGGIFILRADQMTEANYILLYTAARVVLEGDAGSLQSQLATLSERPTRLPRFLPGQFAEKVSHARTPIPRPDDLLFDNSWGGFSPDGKEYVIYLEPGDNTPAPWINVVANERFGFLASETGGGYSWANNSGENRLTSWRNDPVSDVPAEAIYLRDEETGEVWSPTPQPRPADAPYKVRHGAGYTIYEHSSHGLKQTLRLFVPPDAPVKILKLRLENASDRPRRITTTYYAEWVLGTDRSVTQPFIIPTYRPEHKALLARNPYNSEFQGAVAFAASDQKLHGLTADREEFLGRLGSLSRPAALERIGLSDDTPVGADPAAVLQIHLDLEANSSKEVIFLLGEGEDEAEALAVVEKFQDSANVEAAWDAVGKLWDRILGTISVETPDPAMDLLLNRWLLYQALACRVWGRSALYQSSGAYGFRDQLQDVMSLVHARPDLARAHLLRSARHQFEAGDVLHWWHPPSGRGVRTRITDDLVWLPLVTAFYVEATGDESVLAEAMPFLTGPELGQDEEERYGYYEQTENDFTLYEHCCRALKRASTEGRHGLPLMGGGDWNDGMNRVGIHGEGESVWLGWFLGQALQDFASICRKRGDNELADEFQQQAEAYRKAIEAEAWDGAWYRRAYYDDGTPLGSQQNLECRLDAIAQSWSVLSGLGDPERARQAMEAVESELVREKERLMLLFTPPFDKTKKDPGYIKGYLPGIRENGGQYTHAALWSIWAFAELKQGDKAEALYRLINPIYRADTRQKAAHYKVEPYVISADVYGVPPHEGRGGWTWYTGSSGWMYRLGVEGILGLRRQGERLLIRPQIPASWPGFKIVYKYGCAQYQIEVEQGEDVVAGVWLDGRALQEEGIPLVDDGEVHEVLVRM
jgi:cyclic beta-1,2-glucan synthetase